jgi:excisionase family DNA binding protein
MAGSEFLDLAGAAEYLNDTEVHVQRLWWARKIAAVKLGRKVRFRKADLDEYIARRTVKALR